MRFMVGARVPITRTGKLMPTDLYFNALYRARLTVDDFGTVVRIIAPQYAQVVEYYCEEA